MLYQGPNPFWNNVQNIDFPSKTRKNARIIESPNTSIWPEKQKSVAQLLLNGTTAPPSLRLAMF
jgi:hypothetical protein